MASRDGYRSGSTAPYTRSIPARGTRGTRRAPEQEDMSTGLPGRRAAGRGVAPEPSSTGATGGRRDMGRGTWTPYRERSKRRYRGAPGGGRSRFLVSTSGGEAVRGLGQVPRGRAGRSLARTPFSGTGE